MPSPLLATKVSLPPRQSRWVNRPRLLDRLNEGLCEQGSFTRRLSLVCAPAGYGKTTLVCEWLHTAGLNAGWLSLEEGDNDPARFMAYLVAAVQQALSEKPLSLVQIPPGAPPTAYLTLLINALAGLNTPVILALDDYHSIHSPAIHNLLAFLLEHQPPSLHLALITREDPLLPIARLRARGHVMEIRQSDLCFTADEVEQYLGSALKTRLSSVALQALERRTEGWIAGLQLAALSLGGRSDSEEYIQEFTGSSRFVLDYLVEEVLNHQSPQVQEFLLKTSILERLCRPLCDAVAGFEGSQALLLALEQANLFIVPLDQQREWFRYHRLFSELLRYRLHSRDDLPEAGLHELASAWFESQGYYHEAIHHALSGQHWKRAGRLIVQASGPALRNGEIATLMSWFRALPTEIVYADPWLCLTNAWALLLTSQFEAAEAVLAIVEKSALIEGSTREDRLLAGKTASARAYLARARGDSAAVIKLSERALELLPETEQVDRGNLAMNLGIAYWHAGHLEATEGVLLPAVQAGRASGNLFAELTAQLFLARVPAVRGQLQRCEPLFAQLIERSGGMPIAALAHYDLSILYYEWNRLDEGREHILKGLEISQHNGNIEFQSSGYLLQALFELAGGDIAAAVHSAEHAYALVREDPPPVRARSQALLSQLALAAGDSAQAEYWLEQMQVEVDAHPFYRFLSLGRPRLLLARGDKASARQLLEASKQKAFRAGWGYGHIATLVLLSLAAPNPQAARDYLGQALRVGFPEGYIRTFADAGEALMPVLAGAAEQAGLTEYAASIIEAIPSKKPGGILLAAGLVEGLSQRELEVLRLAASGCTNQDIADRLSISLGTAKTHIHHIIGKLEVGNRAGAIARARELKLI